MNMSDLIINRVWAMPNRYTFTIKPIKELLKEEIIHGAWCDPFSGKHSPAAVRNDISPGSNAEYHMDALEFLQQFADDHFDGVLYDPPYSFRQAVECYKGHGKENITNMKYWSNIKDQIGRIIKPNGKVICFGWNSMGLGINRGFTMTRILLVAHGGSQNDTIVTVETKNSNSTQSLSLDLL